MITVSPLMQKLLSNADGLTPVIDVSIPMGAGVYAELTTYNQMVGVLEPATYVQIVPAINILRTLVPAIYNYKNSDVNIDATRIRGQLTLAVGTVQAVAAPPAVYGKSISSVYSVSVQHSWKSLGILVNAANNVAKAAKKVTVKNTVKTTKKVVAKITVNNIAKGVSSFFGW